MLPFVLLFPTERVRPEKVPPPNNAGLSVKTVLLFFQLVKVPSSYLDFPHQFSLTYPFSRRPTSSANVSPPSEKGGVG